MRRRTKSRYPPTTVLGRVLILVGIALLSLWVLHKALYIRSLTLSSSLLSAFAQEKPSTVPPVYIEVADHIALPVVQAGYVSGKWLVSDTAANYVAQSAAPGEGGNIIIYGHNKATMFGPLGKLAGGEK